MCVCVCGWVWMGVRVRGCCARRVRWRAPAGGRSRFPPPRAPPKKQERKEPGTEGREGFTPPRAERGPGVEHVGGGRAAPSGSSPQTPPVSPWCGKKSLFGGGDGVGAVRFLGCPRSARCAAGQCKLEPSSSRGKGPVWSDRPGPGLVRRGHRGNGPGASAALGAEVPFARCSLPREPEGLRVPWELEWQRGKGLEPRNIIIRRRSGSGRRHWHRFCGKSKQDPDKKKAKPTQARSEK